jgi:hypothetical protein
MPGIMKAVNVATPLTAGPRMRLPAWITHAQRGAWAVSHLYCAEHADQRRPFRHYDAATGREIKPVGGWWDIGLGANVAVPPPVLRRRTETAHIDVTFPDGAGMDLISDIAPASFTWLAAVYVSSAAITAAATEVLIEGQRFKNGVASVQRISKLGSNRLGFTSHPGVTSVSPVITAGNHLFVAVFDAVAGEQRVYHNSATAADTDAAVDTGVAETSSIYTIGATTSGASDWTSGLFGLAMWPGAIDTAQPAFFQGLIAAAKADYGIA